MSLSADQCHRCHQCWCHRCHRLWSHWYRQVWLIWCNVFGNTLRPTFQVRFVVPPGGQIWNLSWWHFLVVISFYFWPFHKKISTKKARSLISSHPLDALILSPCRHVILSSCHLASLSSRHFSSFCQLLNFVFFHPQLPQNNVFPSSLFMWLCMWAHWNFCSPIFLRACPRQCGLSE